jgi:hypothetical protein
MSVLSYRIKIRGSMGQNKYEALFDSGASDSMIRSDLVDALEIPTQLPEPLSFETAKDGEYLIVDEAVGLDFYIDGIRLRDEFLMVKELSEEVIIGASTMQKCKMKLNFEEDRVMVDPRVMRKILK